MNSPATDDALWRFRERAQYLLELTATDPDTDKWGEILIQEATYLVEEGADAYCRYVDRMDDAADRAQLDQELDARIYNFPNGDKR